MARTLTGLGVSPGTVAGPVARMARPPEVPADSQVTYGTGETAAEVAAARAALEATAAGLESRAARVSGPAAEVLLAQAMMARDPVLAGKVTHAIESGRSGPAAVARSFEEFRAALAAVGGYLADRAADLDDLRDRTIAHLLGLPMPGVPDPGHPFVLVARDLSPADTATLQPAQVLAIVTEQGGPTSHTAILAKSLGIPAVVACADAAELADGARVAVDGSAGHVVVDPDQRLLGEFERRRAARAARLASSSGPASTADGHPVKLLLNLGATREVSAAASADSEGVGLLRTEFLFLDKGKAPTLSEQRQAYRDVFAAFSGRRVVLRTLDAGADKPMPFLGLEAEPNPALGVRGLRIARTRPEVLATQLQAVAEAADGTGAEVWVMAPMVATAQEAAWFAAQARQYGLGVVGVMVEVPAAALRAGQVLDAVDFASLGTNDLAQYTLAADRMTGGLADLLDYWQPALLDLVASTAAAGRERGKPVGVCGEMAGDPLLALVLTGLGVTSLSMAPASVADVRAAVAGQTFATCGELAQLALAAPSAAEARSVVASVIGD
jgi:phosphoenolpyruvate-protein phosphotransferase (PTS system enzyme I)